MEVVDKIRQYAFDNAKPIKEEYKENQWYCKLCIKSMNKLSKYNHVKSVSHTNMIN